MRRQAVMDRQLNGAPEAELAKTFIEMIDRIELTVEKTN
jgi:hypothetical protein